MDILSSIKGKLMNEPVRESKQSADGELSRRGKLVREMVAEFNKSNFKRLFQKNREDGNVAEEKPFVYPEHLTVEKIEMPRFRMELLKWKEKTESRWTILHIHGGGYVGPFKNNYRMMAGLYSEVGRGADVLSVDYRLAPENPFPAALEDARDAYYWLLDNGYKAENIVFAGDSAGGGLALSLIHYLKDYEKVLPAGVVTMSPWTDLTASGKSYMENRSIDPVFGNGPQEMIFDSTYVGDDDPANPYISPMFGDFDDFPPMLIQVGSNEMLLDDSRMVAKKAKAAGVKVKYSEYKGLFHVFQMAATMMPESKNAWIEVGHFLDAINKN